MKPWTLFLFALITLLLVGLLFTFIIMPVQGWVPRSRTTPTPFSQSVSVPSHIPPPQVFADISLMKAPERTYIPLRVAILLTGRINLNVEQLRNFRFAFFHDSTKRIDVYASSSCQNVEVIDAFTQLYQIKEFSKNDAPPLDVTCFLSQKSPEANVRNCLAMYWNREQALKLFPPDHEYDVVISTRADLYFQQQIHLEDYWGEIQKGTIFVPEGSDYGGLNDQLAIGRPLEMFRYLGVYSHLQTMLESGTALHPESLLLSHLQSEHISVSRQPLSFRINRMQEVY